MPCQILLYCQYTKGNWILPRKKDKEPVTINWDGSPPLLFVYWKNSVLHYYVLYFRYFSYVMYFIDYCNLYFWLRFVLVNAIKKHLSLKIRFVCEWWIFNLKCLLIIFFIQNLSHFCFFVYQKSFKRRFKPVFEYKITLGICVLALWNHKAYFVVKKLVRNVCIKAFW